MATSTYDLKFKNLTNAKILSDYASTVKKGDAGSFWDSYRKCLGDTVANVSKIPAHDYSILSDGRTQLPHMHDRLMRVADTTKAFDDVMKKVFKTGAYSINTEGGEYGCRYASYNGAWKHRSHHGIDISADQGVALYGIGSGEVIARVFSTKGSGNTVWVYYKTLGDVTVGYKHMHDIIVGENVAVTTATKIGTVGNTGDSAGNHLHFEVRKGRGSSGVSLGPRTWANDVKNGTTTVGNGGTVVTPPTPPPATGSAAVRGVQTWLNGQYAAGLLVDGIAGAATKTAIAKGAQREMNNQWGAKLVVDGAFGNASKNAWIYGVKQGDAGNITRLIQCRLITLNYGLGLDGVFGATMKSVVVAFQQARGLYADGIVGAASAYALFA